MGVFLYMQNKEEEALVGVEPSWDWTGFALVSSWDRRQCALHCLRVRVLESQVEREREMDMNDVVGLNKFSFAPEIYSILILVLERFICIFHLSKIIGFAFNS